MKDIKQVFALGPKGTYGHEAAMLFRATTPTLAHAKLRFCETNGEILSQTCDSDAAIGIVPIENSTAGLVREVVNFWMKQDGRKSHLRVAAEISLPVHHCLIAHPTVEIINPSSSVLSHPQALAQCAQTLTEIKLNDRRPALSTAAAAQYVAQYGEGEAVLAIASEFAAKVYGLRVLQAGLQDANANETRFHVVGKHPAPKTHKGQKAKTAVLFWLHDVTGALHKALGPIASAEANMSSIHSIPLGDKGKFAFYAEFEGHRNDPITKSVLTLLQERVEKLVILGSFPSNC